MTFDGCFGVTLYSLSSPRGAFLPFQIVVDSLGPIRHRGTNALQDALSVHGGLPRVCLRVRRLPLPRLEGGRRDRQSADGRRLRGHLDWAFALSVRAPARGFLDEGRRARLEALVRVGLSDNRRRYVPDQLAAAVLRIAPMFDRQIDPDHCCGHESNGVSLNQQAAKLSAGGLVADDHEAPGRGGLGAYFIENCERSRFVQCPCDTDLR